MPVGELLFPTGVLQVRHLVLKVGLGVFDRLVVNARTDLGKNVLEEKGGLQITDLIV